MCVRWFAHNRGAAAVGAWTEYFLLHFYCSLLSYRLLLRLTTHKSLNTLICVCKLLNWEMGKKSPGPQRLPQCDFLCLCSRAHVRGSWVYAAIVCGFMNSDGWEPRLWKADWEPESGVQIRPSSKPISPENNQPCNAWSSVSAAPLPPISLPGEGDFLCI